MKLTRITALSRGIMALEDRLRTLKKDDLQLRRDRKKLDYATLEEFNDWIETNDRAIETVEYSINELGNMLNELSKVGVNND